MANVITNVGKALITGRFLSSSPLNLFIAWGTGNGEAAPENITLFTESTETRATAGVSQITTTTTNDTLQAVGTLQAEGVRAITNAGMFDSNENGTLIMKSDFAPLNLALGDSITFTLKIQFT